MKKDSVKNRLVSKIVGPKVKLVTLLLPPLLFLSHSDSNHLPKKLIELCVNAKAPYL